MLTVVPSLTRASLYIAEVKFPYAITFWYLLSVRISYTVDGVLYVLMQKKVRILFWKKVSSIRSEQHSPPARARDVDRTGVAGSQLSDRAGLDSSQLLDGTSVDRSQLSDGRIDTIL